MTELISPSEIGQTNSGGGECHWMWKTHLLLIRLWKQTSLSSSLDGGARRQRVQLINDKCGGWWHRGRQVVAILVVVVAAAGANHAIFR